jgi:hypothetical protein
MYFCYKILINYPFLQIRGFDKIPSFEKSDALPVLDIFCAEIQ